MKQVAKQSDFTHKDHLGYLKIYWYGILFVTINMEKLTGINSWKHNGVYGIDVYSNGQVIPLEFDTAEKWKFVLDLLDRNI